MNRFQKLLLTLSYLWRTILFTQQNSQKVKLWTLPGIAGAEDREGGKEIKETGLSERYLRSNHHPLRSAPPLGN